MHTSGRFLARFLQDIPHLARFLRDIPHLARFLRDIPHLARFLQDETLACKNLARYVISKLCSPCVTSTSQHQIFDEKFDQEPESVRIKMADLAGR